MQPITCNHCGYNYMRHNLDPNAPRLCNSCEVRENQRNPKGKNKMEVVDILITCSRNDQIEIEELCINQGIDFSTYFLNLHHDKRDNMNALSFEATKKQILDETEKSLPKPFTKGKKK